MDGVLGGWVAGTRLVKVGVGHIGRTGNTEKLALCPWPAVFLHALLIPTLARVTIPKVPSLGTNPKPAKPVKPVKPVQRDLQYVLSRARHPDV